MTLETLLLCPVLGVLGLIWARRDLSAREQQIVTWAFVAHALAAIAIVIYHDDIYRGGDMWWYTLHGKELAELLRRDLTAWAPDVLNLAFHRENNLPVTVLLEGTSTGTMSAIAGFVLFATGDSPYGACLLISLYSFIGTVSLFRAFLPELTSVEREPVLIGTLLVPSAVFWSSGIVKEAIVLGGLGLLCLGLARVLRFQLLGLPAAIVGALAIAIVKPYVLFAVVLALGGAFYAQRRHRLSWLSKAVGLAVAMGGMAMMTRWFPEFSLDRIGETMARSQHNFAITEGGSNVDLGGGDGEGEIAGASLAGQIEYLPLALLNVFARPVFFEVRNVSQAIAALEMTGIVVVAAATLRRYGIRRAWTALRTTRWSMFCLVFMLVFAPPVGLATGNLGTLSRYRVPMMPMYAAALLALRARLRTEEQAARTTPPVLSSRPGRRRAARVGSRGARPSAPKTAGRAW